MKDCFLKKVIRILIGLIFFKGCANCFGGLTLAKAVNNEVISKDFLKEPSKENYYNFVSKKYEEIINCTQYIINWLSKNCDEIKKCENNINNIKQNVKDIDAFILKKFLLNLDFKILILHENRFAYEKYAVEKIVCNCVSIYENIKNNLKENTLISELWENLKKILSLKFNVILRTLSYNKLLRGKKSSFEDDFNTGFEKMFKNFENFLISSKSVYLKLKDSDVETLKKLFEDFLNYIAVKEPNIEFEKQKSKFINYNEKIFNKYKKLDELRKKFFKEFLLKVKSEVSKFLYFKNKEKKNSNVEKFLNELESKNFLLLDEVYSFFSDFFYNLFEENLNLNCYNLEDLVSLWFLKLDLSRCKAMYEKKLDSCEDELEELGKLIDPILKNSNIFANFSFYDVIDETMLKYKRENFSFEVYFSLCFALLKKEEEFFDILSKSEPENFFLEEFNLRHFEQMFVQIFIEINENMVKINFNSIKKFILFYFKKRFCYLFCYDLILLIGGDYFKCLLEDKKTLDYVKLCEKIYDFTKLFKFNMEKYDLSEIEDEFNSFCKQSEDFFKLTDELIVYLNDVVSKQNKQEKNILQDLNASKEKYMDFLKQIFSIQVSAKCFCKFLKICFESNKEDFLKAKYNIQDFTHIFVNNSEEILNFIIEDVIKRIFKQKVPYFVFDALKNMVESRSFLYVFPNNDCLKKCMEFLLKVENDLSNSGCLCDKNENNETIKKNINMNFNLNNNISNNNLNNENEKENIGALFLKKCLENFAKQKKMNEQYYNNNKEDSYYNEAYYFRQTQPNQTQNVLTNNLNSKAGFSGNGSSSNFKRLNIKAAPSLTPLSFKGVKNKKSKKRFTKKVNRLNFGKKLKRKAKKRNKKNKVTKKFKKRLLKRKKKRAMLKGNIKKKKNGKRAAKAAKAG